MLVFVTSQIQAQTTAIDFNQQDCDGTQHHLFSELDAGSVVVISFVMMNCSSCITATIALNGIVSDYSAAYPGRVILYSMGYLDTYTCSQMINWRNIGGFSHPVFTGGQAQTNYYGGMGMPTIVVLATNNHTVLYKKLGYANGDKTVIKTAIEQGLQYNPAGISEEGNSTGFRIYPLQTTDYLNIDFDKPESGTLCVFDITGREVKKTAFESSVSFTQDVADLQQGLYIVNISAAGRKAAAVKVLKY